jgi:DNA replication protein DnaD
MINNLKYIDVILYEWRKKGIKNKDDLIRERTTRKEGKVVKLDDYNWLDEEQN